MYAPFGFLALLLAALAVVTGCSSKPGNFQFRMTVEVETPEGLRTGSSVYFDDDGDKFAERTGWLKGDDGFLVLGANPVLSGAEGGSDAGDPATGTGQFDARGFDAMTDLSVAMANDNQENFSLRSVT